MALNPIFRKEISKKETEKIIGKPKVSSQPRKQRSDKKYDVKIPLTPEEREAVRRMAMRSEEYPTNLCTELVKRGLQRGLPFPVVNYPSGSSKCYPAKLEKEYIDLINDWQIKWDCSRKQAAHRILIGMLKAAGELNE
ncbi:hypothetical protein ACQKFO_21615 [Rossellomorea sp. NPDC071047]|uniref:hypothetical protein n=1 Tax=Rossellomorea sp. NPDC071047 TaxID=3390675 RepID=UPI003CFD4D38